MPPTEKKIFYVPGPRPRTLIGPGAELIEVPPGWSLLPPGDPGLTRRVKAAGKHYPVEEKVGRKIFSRGVWAEQATIDRIREELEAERSTDQYARKQQQAARRREKVQTAYVEDFLGAILQFLKFPPPHKELAQRLAQAVALHATPVGSGTVARTTRIPIERRAEAAVIAWMRHQTTAYDSLKIPRVKGERRKVRGQLAQRSREILNVYRRNEPIPPDCPLQRVLTMLPKA